MFIPVSIVACPIPETALLRKYESGSPREEAESYTDCFIVDTGASVALSDFVFAFYTTWLFKLERVILKVIAGKPSTDYEAQQLADGLIDSFAAWSVEARADEQLLMCDFRGRTRSWFMVEPIISDGQPRTRLRFGSAVLPEKGSKTGKLELGVGARLLLSFHRLYSKTLLYSAKRRLEKLLT